MIVPVLANSQVLYVTVNIFLLLPYVEAPYYKLALIASWALSEVPVSYENKY